MSMVALVFGGRSVEHKVSVDSARTVAAALSSAGHEVLPFGVATNGVWVAPEGSRAALSGGMDVVLPPPPPVAASLGVLLATEVDVVFPTVHGTWGEDGTLQGLFESLDLPYVGAGVAASSVAMDKVLCKRVLQAQQLPVVDFQAVRRGEWRRRRIDVLRRLTALPLPVFVKPAVGGSSVGIRKIGATDTLAAAVDFAFRFDDQVLVERSIDGRELECSILGYPDLEASRVGEIVPGREFYDYADKYLEDGALLHAPADLPLDTEAGLRKLATDAFAAIGGQCMGRVDFLLDAAGGPFISEINTLPGFTDISMYPKLWEATGVSLPDLVDRLVRHALERHADRRRLDAGIRDWLQELG